MDHSVCWQISLLDGVVLNSFLLATPFLLLCSRGIFLWFYRRTFSWFPLPFYLLQWLWNGSLSFSYRDPRLGGILTYFPCQFLSRDVVHKPGRMGFVWWLCACGRFAQIQ